MCMMYQCLTCGETFTDKDAGWSKGYMVCPICETEDVTTIWDEEDPPTSPEEFGIKEAK